MADGRLHVGFVLHSLSGGGTERFFLNLARRLIEAEALRARTADFSLEKTADAYVALFEKLARGRAR